MSSYSLEASLPATKILNERVRGVLGTVLNIDAPADDADLIDTGVLDSLALVSLILELETSFGLSVSYDELEIDNFRTVESISKFVLMSLKN